MKEINVKDIISKLKSLSNPENVQGMAKYGINPDKTFGIQIPVLREMAKEIKKDPSYNKYPVVRHQLAAQLWDSEYREARILACMVDDHRQVDEAQMEEWVSDFNSWDVCDGCINSLFEDMGALAWRKAVEWSERDEEFIKRAGFVMMARLAVSDKKAPDEKFLPFLPLIKKESVDGRNFVKKAVNWALRQIGKRNLVLNKKAIATAKEIQQLDSRSAKWIANDAIRELESEAVRKRLK